MSEEEKENYRKEYYLKNKEKIREYYQKNKNKLKEKRQIEKQELKKEYKIKYRELNRIEINKKAKEYREKNKEKINERRREAYLKKNGKIKEEIIKETRREKINKYYNKRIKTDSLFKLSKRIRTSIRQNIQKKGFKKKYKTENILGCSFKEFKDYIESKFEDWMNWDNHGKYNGEFNFGWDLDHIIPISSAITEQEVIKLNHFTNLQPLCSKINRYIKKNKLDF